jgi:hypothetical protein
MGTITVHTTDEAFILRGVRKIIRKDARYKGLLFSLVDIHQSTENYIKYLKKTNKSLKKQTKDLTR